MRWPQNSVPRAAFQHLVEFGGPKFRSVEAIVWATAANFATTHEAALAALRQKLADAAMNVIGAAAFFRCEIEPRAYDAPSCVAFGLAMVRGRNEAARAVGGVVGAAAAVGRGPQRCARAMDITSTWASVAANRIQPSRQANIYTLLTNALFTSNVADVVRRRLFFHQRCDRLHC